MENRNGLLHKTLWHKTMMPAYMPVEDRWSLRLRAGAVSLLTIAVAAGCTALPPAVKRLHEGVQKVKAETSHSAPNPSAAKTAIPMEQATSADAFVDSIGVQTHINYIDTPYAEWAQVFGALKRLGVRHVRDALPNDATYLKNHHNLADAKIGCTCGFAIDDALTAQRIVGYARAARDVEVLEAPNECDAAANCGGGGALGARNVAAFLPVITEAGKILGVPVLGPSFTMDKGYKSTGDISSLIAYNNLHLYFGGRNPGSSGWGGGDPEGHRYGSFEWWMDQANINAPGKPDFITETGYLAYRIPHGRGTIPEQIEASYTPRMLLLAWKHGIKRTFLYELLDETTVAGYGLLRHDLSPKPAFSAVQSLISILSDPGSGGLNGDGAGGNFSPSPLAIALEGDKTNGLNHMLFQKRDGSYYLVVWIEKSSYDAETNTPTPVLPQTIRLTLDRNSAVASVSMLDDEGLIRTQSGSHGDLEPPFSVDEHLTIIRIVSRRSSM